MRAVAILSMLLLAGCVGASETPNEVAVDEPAPASALAWPEPETAPIRPGAQFGRWAPTERVADNGACTTNFVFTGPDHATLYIGTAAHCVERLALGDEAWIAGRAARATLAYSSWLAMEEAGEGKPSSSAPHPNDFALLEIAAKDRTLVHPALLGWGGPTGIAVSDEVAAGDGLLAYGNSSFKPDDARLRVLQGALLRHKDEFDARGKFDLPFIPADSGSPVLTADGLAFGVLVTLATNAEDPPGANGIAKLDRLLAYAAAHGAPPVQLATAPLA